MAWKKIEDENVQHYWKCPNAECNLHNESIVTPDWYEDNGTPVCGDCGEDMKYVKTKINVKNVK